MQQKGVERTSQLAVLGALHFLPTNTSYTADDLCIMLIQTTLKTERSKETYSVVFVVSQHYITLKLSVHGVCPNSDHPGCNIMDRTCSRVLSYKRYRQHINTILNRPVKTSQDICIIAFFACGGMGPVTINISWGEEGTGIKNANNRRIPFVEVSSSNEFPLLSKS
nr:hypothetical protein Iba_chr06aCG8830 [Ipomoea batatas]